ncbi:hypothetical protein V6N11_030755 [Hibiscus sabdariffa]|uniref:Uncharacterized protein n=1 Tax=Hibiscus sabdariffa TaxID=183260 RepID=A0ABR2NBT8_9ROSI
MAVLEVLPVDAAAMPLNGGASIFNVKSRRLLQVPANPWQRGCSRLTRDYLIVRKLEFTLRLHFLIPHLANIMQNVASSKHHRKFLKLNLDPLLKRKLYSTCIIHMV